MLRFIVRRLLWAIPTLLIVTFLVFWRSASAPTRSPSYMRSTPGPRRRRSQQFKEANGLVGSIPEQYFRWLGNFVTGDWGISIKGNRPVWPELKDALANTLVLGDLRHRRRHHRRPGHRHLLRPAPVLQVRHGRHDAVPSSASRSRRSSRRSCCSCCSPSTHEVVRTLDSRSCRPPASTRPATRASTSVLRLKHMILPVDGRRHPDHRRLQPLHAGLAARGQELRLHAHRPRRRGSASAG